MLKDSLIGYEDNFYSKIYRSKLIERHQKKIDEINNRKNQFVNKSVDIYSNFRRNNNKSKHKRKLSFYDPGKK